MKWLYKIWSGYDGFRPSKIEQRMQQPGKELNLGWAKYASAAEPGDEVWVWFQEGSRFTPGVYAKGIVQSIDPVKQRLVLQTQEWSLDKPLTNARESARLATIVAPKNRRQVFVLPDDFRRIDQCSARSVGAPTCSSRQCSYCSYWESLPQIRPAHVNVPNLLAGRVAVFAPGFWVIATRSYVWNDSAHQRPGVRRTTEMFYRFKTGEAALAYPLALGMVQALAKRDSIEADAIVPIPLSPEKIGKEIHRTKLLADALGKLIGVKVVDALRLGQPIGKRAAQNAGTSMQSFRATYREHLSVDGALANFGRIILVDDVCTRGNTFAATISALRAVGIGADIVASSAGQMTIQSAVADDRAVLTA